MITEILAFVQCAENARSFSRSHSDGFVGMAGTAFNRMPSKHKIIKKLTKLGKIVPIETLGVDVYEYTKPTE